MTNEPQNMTTMFLSATVIPIENLKEWDLSVMPIYKVLPEDDSAEKTT